VDAFIVRQNIQRELNADKNADGIDLDTQYFTDLSDDAVPDLVSALRSPSLSDPIKDKVGAALACIRYARGLDEREYPWQSFHFARFTADKALASVKKTLDGYTIRDMGWPVKVITPEGGEFECNTHYYD
jgi:hypothetical protein